MLNRIINKVKEAHNALVADIKRKSLVNKTMEREAAYYKELDAQAAEAEANPKPRAALPTNVVPLITKKHEAVAMAYLAKQR